MAEDKPIFNSEYVTGAEETTGSPPEPAGLPEATVSQKQEEQHYGFGKPRRIIIRATLTKD